MTAQMTPLPGIAPRSRSGSPLPSAKPVIPRSQERKLPSWPAYWICGRKASIKLCLPHAVIRIIKHGRSGYPRPSARVPTWRCPRTAGLTISWEKMIKSAGSAATEVSVEMQQAEVAGYHRWSQARICTARLRAEGHSGNSAGPEVVRTQGPR